MNSVSPAILETYLGKSMSKICENHYDTATQNHCAHFVSHVLGLKLGTLCGDMAYPTRGTGASVRCNELYNLLQSKGAWADAPSTEGVLVFVTSARHVQNNVMNTAPKKHVGIVSGGAVYNYGNTNQQVRKEASTDAFLARMSHAYRADGNDISLFYGIPQ